MLYKNAYVYTADRKFTYGGFETADGLFGQVFAGSTERAGTDLNGAYVIPGLIDIHTHGNSGADFSDGDAEGLKRMGVYYASRGVTSFAPTSMTLPYDVLKKAFASAAAYAAERPENGARLVGIHMEGPYFSNKKKGAQNGEYLRRPVFSEFKALYEQCGGLIRIVDVAAELPGAAEFAAEASRLCTVSIAHTDADYAAASKVLDSGASHLTHLFNGMPSLHHREPGPVGAGAERDNVRAELICDGMHVHPSAVRLAFKMFPGRICLISDSLRCCGMPDGEYELGGQRIFLNGIAARLADGTLAGSALNVYDGMLNAIRFGIPAEEAVAAATVIPAEETGCADRLGSIAEGKYADFVVCDSRLNRLGVYMAGRKLEL